MGKYFGTDGFRGEVNVTLTADHACRVGRFLGWYFTRLRQERGLEGPARVIIGRDTRRSCDMLEHSLVGGLTASGADAYLLHVTTTPSVAHLARTDGFDCGIMISASHNPYYDNGIKLISGSGGKMDEETVALVEAWLEGSLEVFGQSWQELPLARREQIGRAVDYGSGRQRYMDCLTGLAGVTFRGMKVGLDCANGSAWEMARTVFDALGAETYVIHGEPDGCNINRDCGSTHMEALRQLVVDRGLDVGFAYDGDADRCLCVDEQGNTVTGDHILYICGRFLKEQGKLPGNTVVTTVMSNFGLYKAFDRLGIQYAKTDVGDKYVWEYMTKNGCALGGEQSGHIIFSGDASTGDGILTSLKIMEVMAARGRTLSQLCKGLVIYPQVLKNIPVADRAAAQADPEVQAAVAAAEAKLGSSGRILVRGSGTEPLIRVMAEARSRELCESCVEEVLQAIRRKSHGL